MDIDETIEDLRQGKFEVDCPLMTLTQNAGDGEVYKGKGYIRQGANGALRFKLYVTSSENAISFRGWHRLTRTEAGKLFDDSEYYELTATGLDGAIWIAKRIDPSFESGQDGNTLVVTGTLTTVQSDLPLPQPSAYIRVHFFNEYPIPLLKMSETERNGDKYFIRDLSEFEFDGMKFEARKREGSGETTVEVTGDTAFSDAYHLRIQEALQFLTGETLTWRARLRGHTNGLLIELASATRTSSRTHFPPPISPVTSDYMQHGWSLFRSYLKYVDTSTPGTYWNPLAYHLYNAREATANSMDAGALGVGVALEAIASFLPAVTDEGQTKRLASFKEHIDAHLTKHPEFDEFAGRVKTMIGNMSKRTVADVLHALANDGGIERKYIKSWKDLRNRHAHPNLSQLGAPTAKHYQQMMDDTRRTQTLIHQVIFHLIGYQGPFTDYGAERFPQKHYPLDL